MKWLDRQWTSWRTLAFASSSRSSLRDTPESIFGRPPGDSPPARSLFGVAEDDLRKPDHRDPRPSSRAAPFGEIEHRLDHSVGRLN
jgi:hypothetical protein